MNNTLYTLSGEQPLMRWVKASDRLPDDYRYYFVKIEGRTKNTAKRVYDQELFENIDGDYFSYDQIEWLEELDPSSLKVEPVEKEKGNEPSQQPSSPSLASHTCTSDEERERGIVILPAPVQTSEPVASHTSSSSNSIEHDPFIKYPHLQELKREAETVKQGSADYWRLRCAYLEKSLDPTYSEQERNNCQRLYLILKNRNK